MLNQEKIDRINWLAKKSKTTGLTAQEKEDQQQLRKEYVQACRGNLQAALDSVVVVDKNGNHTPLKRRM